MTDRSALNPGLSMMNFDGLDLQNQQEKELQRESEQQQNEVGVKWSKGHWTLMYSAGKRNFIGSSDMLIMDPTVFK